MGCKVFAEMDRKFIVEYSINHTDLSNFSEINQRVKNLVMSFLVEPKTRSNP